ncbi:wall-associated receptor kinase 4-like [Panicum miliaceum]|uniref:Wall-associated receptor kinase 4-like n=1 Tax=Panicum miliaceum TaxID=4540 RepID=A0A3L6QLT0_PANMI|nr:wall-associated receptor kinase 4-like [Panicum miliaceum]
MSPAAPSLLLCTLLLAVATLAAALGRRGCPTKCGDVDVPYPFGIGAGCFRSKGFEISCVNNGTMAVLPSATHYTIPVTSLSVAPQPEVKVMLPVAYRCYNSTGGTVGGFDGHVDVNTHGVYRISDSRNAFVVLGCNTGAYTSNSVSNGTGRYNYQYYMGCFAYCSGPGSAMDGRCASVGCCRVDIAPGLTDNVVSFEDWPHDGMDFSPCDIAFLVDKDGYDFRASDLRMDVEGTSMPVWLDWAIRDESALTCAAARNSTRYACVSANNIDECTHPEVYPCYGICKDTEGTYHCNLIIEFHRVLAKNNSGRAMFDKDISVTEEDVFVLEEMGKLAIECLNEEVEDRPDMKEVAEQLLMLRRAKRYGEWNYRSPHHFE